MLLLMLLLLLFNVVDVNVLQIKSRKQQPVLYCYLNEKQHYVNTQYRP